MNLIERLRAVSETGVTPELIDEVIERIAELEAECDELNSLLKNESGKFLRAQARLDAVAKLPRYRANSVYGWQLGSERTTWQDDKGEWISADELAQVLEQEE